MSRYSDEVMLDGPTAYYPLDDTDTVMRDTSGNGRNGTYAAVPRSEPGLFDGSGTSVGFPSGPHSSATLPFSPTSGFTVEGVFTPGSGGRVLGVPGVFTLQSDTAVDLPPYVSDLPPIMKRRWHSAVIDSADRVYVIGGIGLPTSVQRFDPATGVWTEISPIASRDYHSVVVDSADRVYVLGGVAAGAARGFAERFDPATGVWTRLPDISPRYHAAAVVDSSDRVYALGGLLSGSVQRFDPVTGVWTNLPDIRPRHEHSAVIDSSDRVYVLGGYNGGDSVQRFDPATGVWTDLPNPVGIGRFAAVIDSADRVYVLGGDASTTSAQRFDPATGVWTTLPNIKTRYEHSAVIDSADRVYVIGGIGSIASVQRFDPATGVWTDLPNMDGRGGFAAVIDSADRVYALGGDVSNTSAQRLTSRLPAQKAIPPPSEGGYHVAITVQGSTLRRYLNGRLSGAVALSNAATVNAPLELGALTGAFTGRVDEVSVHGSALSAERVAAHFTAIGLWVKELDRPQMVGVIPI